MRSMSAAAKLEKSKTKFKKSIKTAPTYILVLSECFLNDVNGNNAANKNPEITEKHFNVYCSTKPISKTNN